MTAKRVRETVQSERKYVKVICGNDDNSGRGAWVMVRLSKLWPFNERVRVTVERIQQPKKGEKR